MISHIQQLLNHDAICVTDVGWSTISFGNLSDEEFPIYKVSLSLDGAILSVASADKVAFYSRSKGLIHELACENAAKGEWINENIWVAKSQERILVLDANDKDSLLKSSNLLDSVLQNYSAESFLVFPRDESGVIFVLDPTLWEITRLELDSSQAGPKPKIRWRWTIEGSHDIMKVFPNVWTTCASKLFTISDGCLIAFELKHGNEKANVLFQVNVNVTDIDELITDDGKLFQLRTTDKKEVVSLTINRDANNKTPAQVETTVENQVPLKSRELVPIDNSERLFFRCSTKRVVFLEASVVCALKCCQSLQMALDLANTNQWEDSLVLAVMFDKALDAMDISAAETCLTRLTTTKLTEDIRSRVASSIQNHFRTLAMDEHLSNLVESFLVDCLRQYGDQSCAEALNDLRMKIIAYEYESERSRVDDETFLPADGASKSLQFTFPSGWKCITAANDVSKSTTEEDDATQCNKDRDLQRVRKAIGTRWNAWTRMTDTQIVFDALERGLLSTCCAFLVARHQHPNQDGLESDSSALQSRFSLDNKSAIINEETALDFVLSCIQTRALQQLCDYTKTETSLLRGGMDPLHFYQQVLLHTYNRTLRRNVMYHLMNCEHKNTVLTPEMVEAEKFLSQLEAVLPCKSHAVALRRSWSCLLEHGWTVVSDESHDDSSTEAIRRRWPPTGRLNATTVAWRSGLIHQENSAKLNPDGSNQTETNSAQWSGLLKELSVPLMTDSRDGDDERCVETVCATCRAAMEDGSFYLDDHNHNQQQDKVSTEEDAFALFLRFSLKSVMSADWETKWRVLKEAGLHRHNQNAVPSKNELQALVRYLADHNDWRGLKDFLLTKSSVKNEVVKQNLRFFSPFLLECLKDELFEYLEDAPSQLHSMKKAALAYLFDAKVELLHGFVDQFAINGLVDGVHLLLNSNEPTQTTGLCSSLGKLGTLVLAKRYSSPSYHHSSTTAGGDCSLLFQAAELCGVAPKDVFEGEHDLSQPLLEGVKRELILLSLLALAPCDHEIFEAKDKWIEFAKVNSKIFPELFVGLLQESTVKSNKQVSRDAVQSLFTKEYENEISEILKMYFGWTLNIVDYDKLKTLAEDDDERNKLGTEFFLKQRRPFAAFMAWERDCDKNIPVETRKNDCVQLARKVALDRPHDGLILSACCAFLDLCLNEEAIQHQTESESAKLRVDALTLSSILAGTDLAAHEEAEIVELFTHFDNNNNNASNGAQKRDTENDEQQSRPNLHALRALQMLLQSSVESDTAEIFPLAFRFCSIHKLPPSLLMLSNLSLQKDLFALLAESDANKIDETVLKDFLRNDKQLREGERMLALKSLGMDWIQLESLLVEHHQQQQHHLGEDVLIVDTILYSSNPSLDLLQLAVQRRESRFAAMATCFEGCDSRLAWIGFLLSSIHHSKKLTANLVKSIVKMDDVESLELATFVREMATMTPGKQPWKTHQMDEQDERILMSLVSSCSSRQVALKRLLRCVYVFIQHLQEFDDISAEVKAVLETSALAFESNDPYLAKFILFVIGAIDDGNLDEQVDLGQQGESVVDHQEERSLMVKFQQEILDYVVSHLVQSNEKRIVVLKSIVLACQNQLSRETIQKYLSVLSRLLFIASEAHDQEIINSIVNEKQLDRWLNGDGEYDVVLNRLLATDEFELAFEYASLVHLDTSSIVILECQRYLAALNVVHVDDVEIIVDRLKEKKCADEVAADFLLKVLADNKDEGERIEAQWTPSARARLALRLAEMFPATTTIIKLSPDQVHCLRLGNEFGCDLSHLVRKTDEQTDTNSKELTALVGELVHHVRFEDLVVLARAMGGSCLDILQSCAQLLTSGEWRVAAGENGDTMVAGLGMRFKGALDGEDVKSLVVAEENGYASIMPLNTLNRLLSLHRRFPDLKVLGSPNKLNKELIREMLASEKRDDLLSFADLIIHRLTDEVGTLAEMAELFLFASKHEDVWDLVLSTVQNLRKEKELLAHLLTNYREDAVFILLGKFAANRLATSVSEMNRARLNSKRFCTEASPQDLVALLALQKDLIHIDDPECEKIILTRLVEDDAIDLLCDEIGRCYPMDVATRCLVQKHFFHKPLDCVTILNQVKIGKAFQLFDDLAVVLEKQGALLAGDGADLVSKQCFAESAKLHERIVNGH